MTQTFQPRNDSPLLLFGGPYGNLEALQALFAAADACGIARSNWLCTGDLAAYCADPLAVVEAVRGAGIAVVQGNCEEALGQDLDDCGCGFSPGSTCDLLSVQWYRHARGALDPASRAWMRALPPHMAFDWGGQRWLALHGGLHHNARFLFASTPAADFAGEVPDGIDVVVAGHCGIPFDRELGPRLWHNPGVIGMPANDGTARTWYSTVHDLGGALAFRHHALDYDAAAARRRMHERGLPAEYADALLSGLWPSLDVLPPHERAAAGVALAPPVLRRAVAAPATTAPGGR